MCRVCYPGLRAACPLIGVNHIEGHFLAVQLEHAVPFPFLCLIASGGHTSLYLARDLGDYALLGGTRDDAAGEAFDKAAKMLGLGYPGGRVIDRLAQQGDPTTLRFPRAHLKNGKSGFSYRGVSANSRLRQRMREEGESCGLEVFVPSPKFCTDNAAMIACAGAWRLARGQRSSLDLNASATLRL